METVHNAIAWYQKKIGSYDKQLWEESVEKKLLKVPPNVKNAPKKSVRLKTEYIDVDLIRGSTFTKTKPQVPWIYITRKAIARVIFFPFYYKWWVLQTSVKLYLLLLVLYVLQLISIIVYLRNLDHSIVEDELSFTEVTLPVILMFLLCLVHSQTVLAHIGHKPPKRTKTIPRVIRPEKPKKTVRKGQRPSGNNSSACQDDSCTSSRPTKTSQVGKRRSDLSSSSSKQQISQSETLSFPEMSQSNIKSGSSSESNVSALSKSTKDENSTAQNSLKTDSHDCKADETPISGAGKRKENKVHGNGRVSGPCVLKGGVEEQKLNATGSEDSVNEVFSSKFDVSGIESTDKKGPLVTNRSDDVIGKNLAQENIGNAAVSDYECMDCPLSEAPSEFQRNSGNASSSLVVESTKCDACGNQTFDVSVVSSDNDCQSYSMQGAMGNGCENCGHCHLEKRHSDNPDSDKGFIGKFHPCNSASGSIDKQNEQETCCSCSKGEKNAIGGDEDECVNVNDGCFSCSCGPCDVYPPPSSSSRPQSHNNENGGKNHCHRHHCDNATEDSGIHSNLSSMDSVGSCHNTLPLSQGTEPSPPVPSQPMMYHHHSSTVNKVESPSTATPTEDPLLFPSSNLKEEEEESDNTQSSSITSSSLSTQKENIFHNKSNEKNIAATTITNPSVSSSTSPSSSNAKLLPSTYQTNDVNKSDGSNTDKNIMLCEQQQLCSSRSDNCLLRLDNQPNKHSHCPHNCLRNNQSSSVVGHNNTSTHSTAVTKATSSCSSLSSSCGIQCFSELFAQEILNSETLREVSSTILMTASDLDCSSSSATGPLSSASFSSSSSAFSTNNMFSLPTKQTSSYAVTATPGKDFDSNPKSLTSKSSHVLPAESCTVTCCTACIAMTTTVTPTLATSISTNTHSNGHVAGINNNDDDDDNSDNKGNVTILGTTTSSSATKSTSYLNLPKRRHFASRLPISHQHRQNGIQEQQREQQQHENGSINSVASICSNNGQTNLGESMEMDMMATVPTTSDADQISDISNYSPSESDSDAAGMEDLRNRCEEKRRKQLRFQELSVITHINGGTNSGSLSPHLSGASYKIDTGSIKPNSPNGAVSRSMVNGLTRKPSPLKDLSLTRKLNSGTAAQTSSASDVGKSESTTRSCLRRRRRTSGNVVDADMSRTRSVPSSIGISMHSAQQQEKNKVISSSENEGVEGYAAEGVNKATMSSEEWEDRIPLDESTSSNYSSSCDNSDSEEVRRDGEEVEEEEEEKTEYTTSTLHVINLLQPQAGSPSNSGNASQPDKVSCLIWEMNECKKVDLTALDIGWAIIDKVDSLPESSDYFIIGMLFSVLMGLVPLAFRGFVNKSWTNMEDLLSWSGLVNKTLHIPDWFVIYTWRQNLLMFNGILQRFFLSLLFFFLLSVADRTFKQRLLYAKHFSYLTSSRRARKFSMPHFRLNKVRNIKIWLSLRSYLKRRGPQRSVDVIVSASFMCGISVVCLISLQMLKDSGNYLDFLCNWELLVWCLALAVFLLRFMTLGLKINKKYRNLSVLITEQINLYLQMEQKPHKKEELVLANNVLRLAEDLLKELESPFKISGFSANPFIYNITKVIVLSAFSAVLTELLGFKLKLHKIKLKG